MLCGASGLRKAKKRLREPFVPVKIRAVMRKIFPLFFGVPVAIFFTACNPISYFMLYEYSSSEKPDGVADQRMTELENERGDRMHASNVYRSQEIQAYEDARGVSPSPESISTRPVSTEELRERLEREAEERERRRGD